MSKITLALAAAGGYVLGARAGRERYDQIAQQASRLWSDPRVQRAKDQAKDTAAEAGVAAKDTVVEKVQDARHSSSDSPSSSSSTPSTPGTPGTPSAPAKAPASGPVDVPTPADMPEHPAVPGTAADGPGPVS